MGSNLLDYIPIYFINPIFQLLPRKMRMVKMINFLSVKKKNTYDLINFQKVARVRLMITCILSLKTIST